MLLLMIGTTVQGESRISRSSFQTANFAEPMQGRNLNGRVIQEPVVDSMTSCQFECMEDERCQSYNFGSNSSGKGFKCELSDSDRFARVMNFTVAEGFGGSKVTSNMSFSFTPSSDLFRITRKQKTAKDIKINVSLFQESVCEAKPSLCGDKGVCIPNYQNDKAKCNCSDGVKGHLAVSSVNR